MGPGSSSPRNCWQFGSLTESSQPHAEDQVTSATLQVGKPRLESSIPSALEAKPRTLPGGWASGVGGLLCPVYPSSPSLCAGRHQNRGHSSFPDWAPPSRFHGPHLCLRAASAAWAKGRAEAGAWPSPSGPDRVLWSAPRPPGPSPGSITR